MSDYLLPRSDGLESEGDSAALEIACAGLRHAYPGFEKVTYVESLAYELSRDRRDILDALQLAGSQLSG